MTKMVGFVLAGMLLLQAAPAWSRTGPHFDMGVGLMKRFEHAEAIQAFEQALDWPGNTRQERATIYLYIGVAQSHLTDYSAAEASFKRSLALDPSAELPKNTSPKITALLERVRGELRPAKPVATPPQVPPPASTPATVPVEEPRAARRSTINWPAWITLGGAVAAGVTGLALGLASRSAWSSAEDKKVSYDEAVQHADDASSRAIGADIMFGVAGAAAIASGVLFYLGSWRKHPDREVSAAVVPTPSGAMVQIGVRR